MSDLTGCTEPATATACGLEPVVQARRAAGRGAAVAARGAADGRTLVDDRDPVDRVPRDA